MEINVTKGNIANIDSEAVVTFHFEGETAPSGDMVILDQALGGNLSDLVSKGEIKGKFKEVTQLYTFGKIPASRVYVAGLGKRDQVNAEKLRIGISEALKSIQRQGANNVAVTGFIPRIAGLDAEIWGKVLTEGSLLGTYSFKKYVTHKEEEREIQKLTLLAGDDDLLGLIERGSLAGKITAESVNLVRDMVNEPGNIMTPTRMAEIAHDLAQKHGLEIHIMEKDDMMRLGMGGLLGVAQGSQQPPKFIVLYCRGRTGEVIDIALVGKGITFDSGGISIKPSEGMGDMKGDMAGGAAVIGAISAVAQLKIRINAMAIIPATENLPGGNAFKPGDIIRIMNGKTVEIISTDAEGRLILADALSYAVEQKAQRIIDVATLTGACRIALGDVCTGAFSNNEELVNMVINSGKNTGECIWQMPMNEEYREQNKSDVADIKNTGGRYAGAITAAWFLREFAGETPWVHLDIAGTSMLDKERGYNPRGATGVPVRTLVDLMMKLAECIK